MKKVSLLAAFICCLCLGLALTLRPQPKPVHPFEHTLVEERGLNNQGQPYYRSTETITPARH